MSFWVFWLIIARVCGAAVLVEGAEAIRCLLKLLQM